MRGGRIGSAFASFLDEQGVREEVETGAREHLATRGVEVEEQTANSPMIVVKAAYDEQACVWYTLASNLPGLIVEASTLARFGENASFAAADLLEIAEARTTFDLRVDVADQNVANPPTSYSRTSGRI